MSGIKYKSEIFPNHTHVRYKLPAGWNTERLIQIWRFFFFSYNTSCGCDKWQAIYENYTYRLRHWELPFSAFTLQHRFGARSVYSRKWHRNISDLHNLRVTHV